MCFCCRKRQRHRKSDTGRLNTLYSDKSIAPLIAGYSKNIIILNFVSSDNDIKQNNRNNGIADDTGNRRELVHLHGTYT